MGKIKAILMCCFILPYSAIASEVKTYQFDIPRQEADKALTKFARQAEKAVFFPVDGLANIYANPLKGAYTVEEGLSVLLQGTGYAGFYNNAEGVLSIKLIKASGENNMPLQTKSKKGKGLLATIIAAIAAGGATTHSVAQENNSRISGLMEEVTVTARKREEGLQDTPISISAFTGDSLEARGVAQVNDIQNFTPNLTFQNGAAFGGASSSAVIFIRGIGQSDFLPTVEPGVGLYVDGIYYGRSVGSVLDLIDIERVEVLRGPQGTLFGRNTIGGAISIVSKKPAEEFGGYVETTIGSDSRFNGKASVDIPLSDTVFTKFSVASLSQDGYVDQRGVGSDLGDDETLTGRFALLWQASDNVEVNWSVDASRDREAGVPYVVNSAFYTDISPSPNFVLINNTAPPFGCGAVPPNVEGSLANPNCYNAQYFSEGSVNSGDKSFSNVDTFGTSVTVDWAINENMEFKSITSFRQIDSEFAYDGDASPIRIQYITDDFEQEQITQEFQLQGTALDDSLNWIVGLYYFKEYGTNINPVFFRIVDLQSGGHYENDSQAIFSQITYDFTDRWSITAGLRYTDDTKRFDPDQFVINGFGNPLLPSGTPALPPGEVEQGADDYTPMVNVSFQWTDELMVYATFSEGFKGGGFHQRVFPPLPEVPSFDPETVKSYELGFKYANDEGSLRVNGAVFQTDYSDLQITNFTLVAPVLVNAGDATIDGFELDLQASPFDTWFFEAAVGYLDGDYDSLNPGVVAGGVALNNELERLSKWTGSLGIVKEFDLGDAGLMSARLDWSYRSEFFFDALNTSEIAQDGSYEVVNFNLSWDSADDRFGMKLGVTNLTGEEYALAGSFNGSFGQFNQVYARDTEWTLTGKYRF